MSDATQNAQLQAILAVTAAAPKADEAPALAAAVVPAEGAVAAAVAVEGEPAAKKQKTDGEADAAAVPDGPVLTMMHDRFNREKIDEDYLRLIKGDADDMVKGNSNWRPLSGSVIAKRKIHEWVLKADGFNDTYLGVIKRAHKEEDAVYENKSFFGVYLRDRRMYFKGVEYERIVGPDKFAVPMDVTIRLDCGEGTLSMKLGDLDLGVICDSSHGLPKNTPFHVCTAACNSRCKVQIVSYKSNQEM